MSLPDGIQCSYSLDAGDTIYRVDEHWDAGVEREGQTTALSEQILGKPLKSFIDGDITRMLIGAIIDRARVTSNTVSRQYRCDTNTERRLLEMSVVPSKHQFVDVVHRLVKSEPRPRRPFYAAYRTEHVLHCCRCQMIEVDGDWRDVEALPSPLALEVMSKRKIHTVCLDCRDMDALTSGSFRGDFGHWPHRS